MLKFELLPPANEVCKGLCFYRCLSVHGGACVVARRGGACVVALGGGHVWLLLGGGGRGMCGCSRGACMVAPRGACVVAPRGRMHGCSGGCAWLLLGGVCGCSWGEGGVRGFFDEIWSMSGRYASYWNAFLSVFFSNRGSKF